MSKQKSKTSAAQLAGAERYREKHDIKTMGITARKETRERWKAAVKQSGLSAEDFLNALLNSAGY